MMTKCLVTRGELYDEFWGGVTLFQYFIAILMWHDTRSTSECFAFLSYVYHSKILNTVSLFSFLVVTVVNKLIVI